MRCSCGCCCDDCENNIDHMGVAEILDNLKERLMLGPIYVITDEEMRWIRRAIVDAKYTVHATVRMQRLNDALAYLEHATYPRDKRHHLRYVQLPPPPPKRGLWHFAV